MASWLPVKSGDAPALWRVGMLATSRVGRGLGNSSSLASRLPFPWDAWWRMGLAQVPRRIQLHAQGVHAYAYIVSLDSLDDDVLLPASAIAFLAN